MKLTEQEIEWLSTSPQGLRVAAEYHDLQATQGEPMGFDCTAHNERHAELKAEADRIQTEWEA
jgi:hypothetical protein